MRSQAQIAIDSADVIVLVTDLTAGVTANDNDVADGVQQLPPVVVHRAHRDAGPLPEPGHGGVVQEAVGLVAEGHRGDQQFLPQFLPCKARRHVPAAEDQLEDGVGLWALLRQEFLDALEQEESRPMKRRVSIATGTAAAPLLSQLAALAQEKFCHPARASRPPGRKGSFSAPPRR